MIAPFARYWRCANELSVRYAGAFMTAFREGNGPEAELERGAPTMIDATIAELERQWQAERTAARHIAAIRAPLTEA